MTYIFCGEDTALKNKDIESIKKKNLTSEDSKQFDYEVLNSNKLSSEVLKKNLLQLPVIAKKRIIILRDCQKLNKQNKDIVQEFIESKVESIILILDFEDLDQRSAFINRVRPHVKLVDYSKGKKLNVFDLTDQISFGRSSESLKILSELLNQGIHPLQILGGLVWYWGRYRNRFAKGHFRRGLTALKDADLDIKRSRLKPDYALEVLVVKLCSKG